ncbi:uncharacterized protein CEXT_686101, partial [Caerostris extrusa]
ETHPLAQLKNLEVRWSKTAANTEDIQFCPNGYTGEVRRHCNLKKDDEAVWGEPDYSRCLSSEFLVIQDKFESLRMGYLITEVGTLMQELKLYLWNMRDRFHIAEGEPVVDLLEGLLDYQRKHGKSDENQFKNNSQIFLDIVSFLLDSPRLIQKQSGVSAPALKRNLLVCRGSKRISRWFYVGEIILHIWIRRLIQKQSVSKENFLVRKHEIPNALGSDRKDRALLGAGEISVLLAIRSQSSASKPWQWGLTCCS